MRVNSDLPVYKFENPQKRAYFSVSITIFRAFYNIFTTIPDIWDSGFLWSTLYRNPPKSFSNIRSPVREIRGVRRRAPRRGGGFWISFRCHNYTMSLILVCVHDFKSFKKYFCHNFSDLRFWVPVINTSEHFSTKFHKYPISSPRGPRGGRGRSQRQFWSFCSKLRISLLKNQHIYIISITIFEA